MISHDRPQLQSPDNAGPHHAPDPAVIEYLEKLLLEQTVAAEAGRVGLRYAMADRTPEEASTIEELFATNEVISHMRPFYEEMQGEYILHHPARAVQLSTIAQRIGITAAGASYMYQQLAPRMDRLGIPRPRTSWDPVWRTQAEATIKQTYDGQREELSRLDQKALHEELARSLGLPIHVVREVIRDIRKANRSAAKQNVIDLRAEKQLGNKAIAGKTALPITTVSHYLDDERSKRNDSDALRLRSRRTPEEIAAFEARVAAYRTDPANGTWTNADIASALMAELAHLWQSPENISQIKSSKHLYQK